MVQPRRHKPHHHQAKKIEAPEKESAKPQGPLIIAISIEKQNLRIYDANGFFAETPISTGMKGHPTPMGVFSVIQKHKLHHSNIYSGAPMPYMQRITWSGVAMHAGVLPGYPASHGCIRMPMAFAVKMWNWTKMGARVVVTPGEITPASFSHPLLVAQKVVPAAECRAAGRHAGAPKSDKASEADTPIKPAISVASLELRSTLGMATQQALDYHAAARSDPYRRRRGYDRSKCPGHDDGCDAIRRQRAATGGDRRRERKPRPAMHRRRRQNLRLRNPKPRRPPASPGKSYRPTTSRPSPSRRKPRLPKPSRLRPTNLTRTARSRKRLKLSRRQTAIRRTSRHPRREA